METIIGLLMILLPVVFKLIGKKLEQASKNQPSEVVMEESPIEDWEKTLKEYLGQQVVVDEKPFAVEEVVPEPMAKDSVEAPAAYEAHVAPAAPAALKPKKQKQQKKTIKKAPILLEEEKKPKEKVDLKKLLVYSEIMKPKYTE